MALLNFPDSPTSGTTYVAPNGTTYTFNTSIGTGVWTAVQSTPLSVTPGSISGTAQIGSTLTYTPGTASGGTSPYTYAYQWKANGTNIGGATSLTYVVAAGNLGQTLTVTITATDAVSQTANATTAPTAAVTASTIPTATYNPTPSTGPTASNTVATGIWNGTADTLSSTGCIEFAVTTGAPVPATVYGQSATAVTTGQTVTIRWKTGGSCTGAADGTVITGTLVAASSGTNTYNLIVDTTPTNFSFTDLSSQALSTAVTSASITLAGPNVTTYLTTTGGTLTTIQASVGGGAFAAIPASGTTMPVEPGQTIQIRGTTGASSSTGYTAILGLGGSTTTWTATTTAVVATITTPSISSPANGATNLNPATNSPAGIPLVASAYAVSNGAGAVQTSSTWEVYKANLIQPETSAITGVATGTVYSNGWSGSFLSGYPGTNCFNGKSVVTPVASETYTIVADSTTATWTAPASIPFTTLKVKAARDTDGIIRINGVDVSSQVAAGSAVTEITITGVTSPLTSLSLQSVTAGKNPRVAAIIIDGTLLVDASKILTLTDATGLADMVVGDVVRQGNATGPNTYSGTLTTTTSWDPAYPPSYSFDGNLNTFAAAAAGGETNTWNASSYNITVNSSLRVNTSNTIIVNGWPNWSVNGTSQGSIPTTTSGQWITCTLPTPYTLSSIVAVCPGNHGAFFAAIEVDGVILVDGQYSTQGTITAKSTTSPFSLTLSPSMGTWTTTQTAIDISRTVTPPAPTTEPPNATNYTAVTGSPFTVSSGPFTTVDVLQSALTTSSTYYARTKYATTNPTAATSSFSAWSSFGTAAAFAPAAGTAMGGGYFGGQINDGGTIYNLIVGPAATAQDNSGLQYKTTATADAPSATFQNAVYGKPANDAGNDAAHPAFQWARALNIGGFTDWYIPAIYELEILYYNLKPDTTANNTGFGINPNAVPARASNYTAGTPAQTTSTLFQTGGAQVFSTGAGYWASTESSSSTNVAAFQFFLNGNQNGSLKSHTGNNARAIRRVSA